MIPSGNLQEFGRDFDIVGTVVYNLYATLPGIVFRPCIAIKVVSLITSVASF